MMGENLKSIEMQCGCVIVRELGPNETAPVVVRDGTTPPRRFQIDNSKCTHNRPRLVYDAAIAAEVSR